MYRDKQNRLLAVCNGRFLSKPYKVRRALGSRLYEYNSPIINGHFNLFYRFI